MAQDTINISGITYTFEIVLRNSKGSIVLPKMLFRELFIEESFMDWAFKGYLVYDNSFEQLERYKKKSNVKNNEFFYFRMDGTDEITIELTPVLKADSSNSNKTQKELPEVIDIMSLNLRGAIYDTEDLSKTTIESKIKKIYFWDYNLNKAINLNQRVSSGEYLKFQNSKNASAEPKDISILNNEDRSVFASDLVNYICEYKLGANVSKDWDTCDNPIFYISPPDFSVSDDLQYILEYCEDTDGYPTYFYFDRYTNEFNLKSYKRLFENYKTVLRERMQFSDPTKISENVVPPRNEVVNTFSLPTFSNILSYKYSKMSASDNMREINSRISTGYDTINKNFIINSETAHIGDVKDKYKSLLDDFIKGNQNPLMVINQDKLLNKNAIEHLTLRPAHTVKDTLEASILLNDAIYIEVLGLPNRVPGTFIEIESDTDTEGIWEDIFLGTWLVVKVDHKITPSTYINRILAVKPNMAEAFKYPDGTEVEKQNIETVRPAGNSPAKTS